MHLNAHSCAVVKMLRVLIELEPRVIQEVRVFRYSGSRLARLDGEVLFEGRIVPVDFSTALNEIEKKLKNSLVRLASLQLEVSIHLNRLVLRSVLAANQVERPEAVQ